MARKQHNLDEVLRSLAKKHDVKVDERTSTISVLSKDSPIRKDDLGNGSWGKIDFLMHHQWFKLLHVAKF